MGKPQKRRVIISWENTPGVYNRERAEAFRLLQLAFEAELEERNLERQQRQQVVKENPCILRGWEEIFAALNLPKHTKKKARNLKRWLYRLPGCPIPRGIGRGHVVMIEEKKLLHWWQQVASFRAEHHTNPHCDIVAAMQDGLTIKHNLRMPREKR
ncbi:MAG: hypothetical protein N3A66_03780 [Planctomycetota bacterium]|nr:hypothetical protein [Planctomycetota bacterium]